MNQSVSKENFMHFKQDFQIWWGLIITFLYVYLPEVQRCITFSLLMKMTLSNKHLTLLPAFLAFHLIMCTIAKAIKTQKSKCVLWQ